MRFVAKIFTAQPVIKKIFRALYDNMTFAILFEQDRG